jgi:uncharacterized membrane protein YgcG
MKSALKTLFTVIGMVFLMVAPVLAQSRSIVWDRWDVFIENVDTTRNRFSVREVYDVRFRGRFSFGSAVIPTARLEQITDVQVYEEGRALQENCFTQQPSFCVSQEDGDVSITYYFSRPIIDDVGRFEIRYTVVGALRVYEAGDQLWWDAIPDDHFGFPIRSATVTVQLPQDYAPREGIDPVVTYGAAGEISVNGGTIVARAANGVGPYESFSVRVQYPHDPSARIARWQAEFDQQRAYDENVRPLVNVGLIALSTVIGLGGVLGLTARYMARGRDPKVGLVPEYLSAPPSSLAPAEAGTLIDERADVRDVLSTLLDLANKGYLVIEEEQQEGFLGIGSASEFTFKRTDKPVEGLREFELTFLSALFPGDRMERTLDSLRNSFYAYIPVIQRAIYSETVKDGLFASSPQTVRTTWGFVGAGLLVVAVLLFFVSFAALENLAETALLVPFAIGAVGVAALILSSFMPAKTREGAEEAAKWLAFREYLRNLERYEAVDQAADRFAAYLPYAVAFGLNHIWLSRFRQLDGMPIPTWYWPTYLGGPYRRGYVPGTPLGRDIFGAGRGLPGELARAGDSGLSLDQVSDRMARGLESMSAGLSTLLDSASRAMTSVPQAARTGTSGSWSSGGGGWSGGGFSGGGGSGGGSRGFG